MGEGTSQNNDIFFYFFFPLLFYSIFSDRCRVSKKCLLLKIFILPLFV